MDEVFGKERCLNQIVWKRQTAHSDTGQGSEHLGRLHDVIFLYSKNEHFPWNMQFTAYDAVSYSAAKTYGATNLPPGLSSSPMRPMNSAGRGRCSSTFEHTTKS